MRITYIHQHFRTPQMPGGTRSYDIASRWASFGHDVRVIAGTPPGFSKHELSKLPMPNGLCVQWLPVRYSHHMANTGRMRSFLDFALRSSVAAVAHKSDATFATSTPLTVAIPALFSRLARRTPFVFEVRDLWPAVPIHLGELASPALIKAARALESAAYREAARVTVFAPAMATEIERVHGSRLSSTVDVNFNGADTEYFEQFRGTGADLRQRLPWLQDRDLICYIGTLGRVNNAEYGLDIARELDALGSQAAVVFVGSGSRAESMRKRAAELGLLDRVVYFVGEVPKYQVGEWFDAADATLSLLVPDEYLWRFSFPKKFFDSLASRTPVITNHLRGGKADVIATTGAGLRVHPTDASSAAVAILEFLSDKHALSAASHTAGLLAKNEYDRGAISKRLEALLQEASDAAT